MTGITVDLHLILSTLELISLFFCWDSVHSAVPRIRNKTRKNTEERYLDVVRLYRCAFVFTFHTPLCSNTHLCPNTSPCSPLPPYPSECTLPVPKCSMIFPPCLVLFFFSLFSFAPLFPLTACKMCTLLLWKALKALKAPTVGVEPGPSI